MRKMIIALMLSALFVMPVKAETVNSIHYSKENTFQFPNNIPSEFLVLINNSMDQTEKAATVNGLRIREEPNSKSKILEKLPKGCTVTVIAEYNGWSCIETCDGIAFIYSKYLKTVDED